MSRSNSLNNSDRTNMKSLVPLRDFKKDYHSYCFNQRMIPRNLKSNLRELDAFGLSIKTLYDHRTDAFIKIRLASQKEKSERKDINPFPRETTLSYFVRINCIISPFDVDYCTFRDFSRAYGKFITSDPKILRCTQVPVTKREMIKLGVESKRKQLKYVHSQVYESDVGHSQVQLVPDSKSATIISHEEQKESFMLFVWDLYLVLGHVLLIVLAVSPLIILPLVAEAASGDSSAKALPYQLTAKDLIGKNSWDSGCYNKIIDLRMSSTNMVVMGIGMVCFVLQIVELTLYYIFQPFQLKFQHVSSISKPRTTLHTIVFLSFGLCLHCWLGYIALVLIWMILSAILDPYKYLPYASAAAVLVAFAAINWAAKSRKFTNKFKMICTATNIRFTTAALKMLPLLKKDGTGKKIETNQIETRALELVESDSFLKNVLHRCNGVDLPTALGMARGNQKAYLAASESLGMVSQIFLFTC
jgi:hypothetical protein